MKATGIVRRIDDLGRVIIPKEIRRTLRIREGDPLEIFTDRDGEIILKKYSPIGELDTFAQSYAEALVQTTGYTVLITDNDTVIASAGKMKGQFKDKQITDDYLNSLERRSVIVADRNDTGFKQITANEKDELYDYEGIMPIISEGDVLGGIVMLSKDTPIQESDRKLLQTAAFFIGRQFAQ